MLVLTRKSQETIRIGDNVVITIVRVKGNTVRVGIEAPRNVRVVRGELPQFSDAAVSDAVPAAGDTAAGGVEKTCRTGQTTETAPRGKPADDGRVAETLVAFRRSSRGMAGSCGRRSRARLIISQMASR